MLDHRMVLIALLAALLAFTAIPSLFEGSTWVTPASRVVPIEVEPDAVTPEVTPEEG